MINYENFVNVNQVAKLTKVTGEFIMFKCASGNLLSTHKFILNLTSEQFFKVQCKLELPETGAWYTKGKSLPERIEKEANLLEIEKNYNDWLNGETSQLENTRLLLCEQFAIYTNGSNYIALNKAYIDMLATPQTFAEGRHFVSIDNLHIISKARESIFEETEYLRRLEG